MKKMVCPACKEEFKKNYKIKLGVSERIDVISWGDSREEIIKDSLKPAEIKRVETLKREESEKMRYQKIYNIDITNTSLYDLVIDTVNKNPHEIALLIIDTINRQNI